MLALLAISFSSSPSNANPAHCVANPLNTSNPIDVYLNYDSFQHLYNDKSVLGGLTLDESIGMVLQALEEWNHSAAGRPFIYKGITTEVRGKCDFAVIRGGAVSGTTTIPWVTSVNAQHIPECSGTSFSIQFASSRPATNEPVPWKTGDPVLPGHDMVVTMTHELGHAQGISHPDKANSFSVMEYGLFHHQGKWWLAIKLALSTGNGGIRLYSSTSGNTGSWTSHGSSGHTYTGASTIGDWTTSNYVRWTH